MIVFLLRHAQAVEPTRDLADEHRPLTALGRRQGRRLGRTLREIGCAPSAIVTSPLVRAVQTAELVATRLKFKEALDVAPELQPDDDPRRVIADTILPRADLPSVMLVGHEPLLGRLLRELLRTAAPGLGKATCVCLEWDDVEQPARFRWVLKPDDAEPSTDPTRIA